MFKSSIGFILLCIFGILATVCAAVKIKKFNVPSAHILHNEDNPEEFILDCEYEIDPTEKGFVLKWLLNDSQIYQWIPNQAHPHTFSFMRNYINANYTVSDDELQKYRALAITKPMKNMSGNYTCSVSTYSSDDKKTTHLQMIVPESELKLITKLDEENDVLSIECYAKNIYPEPELQITMGERHFNFAKKSKQDNITGLYSSTIIGPIKLSELTSEADIDCLLKIPGTTYLRSARNSANVLTVVSAKSHHSIVSTYCLIISLLFWTQIF